MNIVYPLNWMTFFEGGHDGGKEALSRGREEVIHGVAATFMALGEGMASPGIPPPPRRDESRSYAFIAPRYLALMGTRSAGQRRSERSQDASFSPC